MWELRHHGRNYKIKCRGGLYIFPLSITLWVYVQVHKINEMKGFKRIKKVMSDPQANSTACGIGYVITLIATGISYTIDVMNGYSGAITAFCAIVGTFFTIYFGFRAITFRKKEIEIKRDGFNQSNKTR